MGVYYGRGDNLVALTSDVAVVLRGWIDKHDAEHPTELGPAAWRRRKGIAATTGFSGKQYLSFHSGRQIRSIDRILKLESKYTSLSLADDLLTAAGEGHKLETGEIWVGKDPRSGHGQPWRGLSPGGVTKIPAGGQA